jgi:hypothetical protein
MCEPLGRLNKIRIYEDKTSDSSCQVTVIEEKIIEKICCPQIKKQDFEVGEDNTR